MPQFSESYDQPDVRMIARSAPAACVRAPTVWEHERFKGVVVHSARNLEGDLMYGFEFIMRG